MTSPPITVARVAPTTTTTTSSPSPSATVDDMLEWMRERNKATKRFQQACHVQYAQRSPVVLLSSPRQYSGSTTTAVSGQPSRGVASGGVTQRSATTNSMVNTAGSNATLSQGRWDDNDVDNRTAAGDPPIKQGPTQRTASLRDTTPSPRRPADASAMEPSRVSHSTWDHQGNTLLHRPDAAVDAAPLPHADLPMSRQSQRGGSSPRRTPQDATHSTTPRGSSAAASYEKNQTTYSVSPRVWHAAFPGVSPRQTSQSAAARRSIVSDLENEELWRRISELRDALTSRDILLHDSNERVVQLKRHERELTSSIVQGALRHAEAMIVLTKKHQDGAADGVHLLDGVEQQHPDSGAPPRGDDDNAKMGGSRTSQGVWWKCALFTEDEQKLLDDIRRRKKRCPVISEESI
jgi:hypothetical protein